MASKLSKTLLLQRNITSMYLIGAVILVLSAVLWFANVANTPERVFNDMLAQSLSTRSVTVEMPKTKERAGEVLPQISQVQFAPTYVARTISSVDTTEETVKTEVIFTPKTEYARYTALKTSSKNSAGKPVDFSSVIGVWAKGDVDKKGNIGEYEKFLQSNGSELGIVVPIANLSDKNRKALLGQMSRDGFLTPVFSSARSVNYQGRSAFEYKAMVDVPAQIKLTQRLNEFYGFKSLAGVDPSLYRGRSFAVKIIVDKLSKHVVEISAADGQYAQRYSGYDITQKIELPEKAIDMRALQLKLSNLLK